MGLQRHQHHGFARQPKWLDREALGFVLLTVAATSTWIGLYAGLTAKAIGLF
jgi:hypothetical protein